MADLSFEHRIGLQADGVLVAFGLQQLVQLGEGESRIPSKEPVSWSTEIPFAIR
jgi:hypothetical protein